MGPAGSIASQASLAGAQPSASGAPAPSQAVTLFESPDWVGLGLVLAIVGCFLLANGILLRNPRAMVEERFGHRTPQLRSIREFLFHRVQLALGFTFLLSGFALQLYGRVSPPPPGAAPGSPALWIGLVVVLAVALEVAGWWWSLQSMRRLVRRWLLEHPRDLETDTALAREVGELYGIASHGDDTVQSYVARVRKALGLSAVRGAGSATPPRPTRSESEREVEYGDLEVDYEEVER